MLVGERRLRGLGERGGGLREGSMDCKLDFLDARHGGGEERTGRMSGWEKKSCFEWDPNNIAATTSRVGSNCFANWSMAIG